MGSPKFQYASLYACHGFEPRRAEHCLTIAAVPVLTSEHVKTVVTRFYTLYGAKLPLRTANPLRPAYFPVYASSMLFYHPSALPPG